MICPLCLSTGSEYFKINNYPIYQCNSCYHRYLSDSTDTNNQLNLYDDSYFYGGAKGYYDYDQNRKSLIERGKAYGELINRYRSPGVMLDVGASSGFLLQGFKEKGWTGIGLEPNLNQIKKGEEYFKHAYIKGFLEDVNIDSKFDLITFIQVISHFYDIRRAFKKAAELTKPGGYWLIENWKRDSLVHSLMGKKWHEYNPPTVRNWFTSKGLDKLILSFGFEWVNQGYKVKKIRVNFAKDLAPTPLLNFFSNDRELPYFGDDLYWSIYRKKK